EAHGLALEEGIPALDEGQGGIPTGQVFLEVGPAAPRRARVGVNRRRSTGRALGGADPPAASVERMPTQSEVGRLAAVADRVRHVLVLGVGDFEGGVAVAAHGEELAAGVGA